MADNFHEDVCSKLIISQFLFIIEQQTWYQIEAKSLPYGIKFKYTNKLINKLCKLMSYSFLSKNQYQKSYKFIMINITTCG